MPEQTLKHIVKLFCLTLIYSFAASFVPAQNTQKPELVIPTGHADSVTALRFNPRFKLLVSGSSDKTVKIWDFENERELRTLVGHNDTVTAVDISANGAVIASAGGIEDNRIIFWSVEKGEVLGYLDTELHNPNSIVFHPDNESIISGGGDNTIRIWDIKSGQQKLVLEGHTAPVRSVAVSPDGRLIASASEDKTVKIWDATNGKLLRTLHSHTLGVNAVAFSPDGTRLASGGLDAKVKLWNSADGQLLKTLPSKSKIPVSSVSFSPDGNKIVASYDIALDISPVTAEPPDPDADLPPVLEIWETASGRLLAAPEDQSPSVSAVAFSPDGQYIAAGMLDDIIGWESADLDAEGFVLSSESYAVSAVAVSPDGNWLAWGGLGSYINLWNLKNGQELRTLDKYLESGEGDSLNVSGVTSLAFSPDGKSIVQGGLDNLIRVWNVADGRELLRLKGHTDIVNSVYFSPDGKTIVSCANDNTVRIWNAATGKLIKSIPTGNESFIYSAAVSPDGKTIAYGSLVNGAIKIYDLAAGRAVRTIEAHGGGVLSLAFMPDGRLLSYGKDLSYAEEAAFWDTKSGTPLPFEPQKTAQSRMSGFTAFLRYKNRDLQFVRQDARIRVLDLNNRDELLSLVSFGKYYMPEFQRSMKLFSQIKGEKDQAERDFQIDWLVATPEGFFDGTNDAIEKTQWRFNNDTFDLAPAEAFFSEFYYPGLFSDILEGKAPSAPREMAALDRRQPQISIRIPNAVKDANGYLNSRVQQIQVEVTEAPADPENKLPAGDVRDIRLFRNGSLVHLWSGKSVEELVRNGCQALPGANLNSGRRIVCTAGVKAVSGTNNFSGYAFNRDNIKSENASLGFNGSQTLRRTGNLYVLAVGINKYQNPLKDLSYAVADVESIADGIGTEQNLIEPRQYAATQIIKLTDQNATRANILAAIRRFGENGDKLPLPLDSTPLAQAELQKIKPAEPEDALLIYYAGHGTARCETAANGQANCDRFYLIPHEGFPTGDFSDADWFAAIYRRSISDEDLENAFESVDTGKLLFVIDACESGQALESKEKRRGPMNSRGLAQLAFEKGMYILTAAQSQQAALEVSKIGHGLLTYSLLEGFQKADKNRDKNIFEREWFDYAVLQVPFLQIEAMRQRNAENRGAGNKKKNEITFIPGDDAAAEPENRGLQTPRVFYRREDSSTPFIVAKH